MSVTPLMSQQNTQHISLSIIYTKALLIMPNKNNRTDPDNSDNPLICDASIAKKHATLVLRDMSRDPNMINNHRNTIPILRGEEIVRPVRPVLQHSNNRQEQNQFNLEYSAEYQNYVEQRALQNQEEKNLKDCIHNTKLERSFRINFMGTYQNYETMTLEEYIQNLQDFYNLTISTLDSRRKEHAKNELQDLKQGENQSLPEFKVMFVDVSHRYNSVMDEHSQLQPADMGEKFINSLNSNYVELQAMCGREQILKNRLIADNHPEPVPYLDHTGYPANLEKAYQRAKDYEESIRHLKTHKQRLSSFVTVDEQSSTSDRKYTNTKTGVVKTIQQMTVDDKPSDYGITSRCRTCKQNGPQYKGDHFTAHHEEFVQQKRNMRNRDKPAKSNNQQKGKGGKGKRGKQQSQQARQEQVKVALATLKKEAKLEESKAKRAEKNSEKAKQHSEKAANLAQVLSTFE